ncbi:MAG: hypothetical protein MI975_01600 [Cytophagales bacterium]|nr:hypothetical protein [Cytophagales bacterium]
MNSTALKENNPEQLKKTELSGRHAYCISGNDERLFPNEFIRNTDLNSALWENPEHADNLSVCLDSSNFTAALDKDIELVIFKIITELLDNTSRHAEQMS